ncbi:MAG TPA: hypothetical protein VFA51_14680 [Candidatus Udaeobacter sp.]|nr:hypothetical protein [Candidatus Udaeobacter sp.]
MTTPEIKIGWDRNTRPQYEKHDRNRKYVAVNDDDAQRHLTSLLKSCRKAATDGGGDLFAKALDQFFDCGVNCLQPPLPELPKAPEPIKDVFGNPLPNPHVTGDLQGQTILMQHSPTLASFYKNLAESPWQAWKAWEDEKARIEQIRRFTYNSEIHAVNPYADPKASKTQLAKFEKEHPDWMTERCKAEAQPIAFPFRNTKNFNLTIAGKIARNPIIGPLFAEMQQLETDYVEQAKRDAQREIEEARAKLEKMQRGFGMIGANA